MPTPPSRFRVLAAAFAFASVVTLSATSSAAPRRYQDVVIAVEELVSDRPAIARARAEGLQIVNVMWEDTGRYLGSAVGPNISDVTIEVEVEQAENKKSSSLMPVLRFANFSDKTADIKIDNFFINVGNEKKGGTLRPIALAEFLDNPTLFLSLPKNGKIKGGSLLADRDKHVLVSAQHALLPIRKGGKATFRPVIFNYQSWEKNPAVLTLLVTRQGTSATVIDNKRDTVKGGARWGQRLFFNKGGARAPLLAERLADVKAGGVTANGELASSLGRDSNLLMIIQVPLKVKESPSSMAEMLPQSAPGGRGTRMKREGGDPDLDVAVLGHGATEGPFTELDGLTIERDDRFPVRVTVQFYQATSNGVVDKKDFVAMAAQIRKVYDKGDYVGSLVLPDGSQRPTAWKATKAPAGLNWRNFAGLRERDHKYGPLGIGWYRDIFTP